MGKPKAAKMPKAKPQPAPKRATSAASGSTAQAQKGDGAGASNPVPPGAAVSLDDHVAKRARVSRGRDLQTLVNRALDNPHFKHIPENTRINKEVEGLTLRARLSELIENLPAGSRIGTCTYASLARQYSDGSSCIENLKPAKVSVPDARLKAILQKLDDAPGAARPCRMLQMYLGHCGALDDYNLIALCKSTLNARQLSKPAWEANTLAIMQYFVRLDVRSKYHAVYQACLPLFDKCLAQTFNDLKKSGAQLSTFLGTHGKMLTLVCPEADIAEISAHADDLSSVSAAVCRVCNGSAVGNAMMASKVVEMQTKRISSDIADIVKPLREGVGKVTPAIVNDIREKAWELCANVDDAGQTTDRDIHVTFLLGDVKLKDVPDLETEVELRIAAALKSRFWNRSGGLVGLDYEKWVCDHPTGEAGEVEAELIHEWNTARTLVQDLVRNPKDDTFSEMRAIITRNKSAILGLDKTFTLELSFLEGAEALVEETVLRRTLGCLPSQSQLLTFQESLRMLSDLNKSDMCKKAPEAAKERITSVIRVVNSMARGQVPEGSKDLTAVFFSQALTRCSYFMNVTFVGAKGGLVGKPSLDAYLQDLSSRMDEDEAFGISVIEKVKCFFWLLSAEQDGLVKHLTAHALKGARQISVVQRGDVPPNKATKQAAAKAKKSMGTGSADGAAAEAADSVMKFFG